MSEYFDAADVALAVEGKEGRPAICGYIVMCAPKKKHGADFFAPLAYGRGDDGEPGPDMLLRDRGATLFATPADAQAALKDTLMRSKAMGHEWPERYQYAVTTVYAKPSNAELCGVRSTSERAPG